jgi:hypothetical protein
MTRTRAFHTRKSTLTIFTLLVLSAAMLIAIPAVFAYTVISAPTEATVGGYHIELVDYDVASDPSVWTYRISLETATSELSHWVLGLGDCYEIQLGLYDEQEGAVTGPFTTVEGADYSEIEFGLDSRTRVSGLKFGEGTPQVGPAGQSVHTFEIAIAQPIYGEGPIEVGTKAGPVEDVGEILGPICDPTAVKMTSLDASSTPQSPLLALGLLFAGVVASGAVVREIRKPR